VTKITIAIMATMPNLMNFPASVGGVCLSVEALYKIEFSYDLVN
jgi:riboflavin synthase alpha subunit